MEKISVLLVDDHRLIRDSWSQIINWEANLEVVGAASSGNEAIEMAKEKRPRIILMDINMSPLNGFETNKMIRKQSPGCRIIGVSMHALPVYARKMLKLGACGYITKNSSREELLIAIMEVDAGKKYICEEVKNVFIENQKHDATLHQPDINSLSRREIEIAKLIKEGMSSKEIGLELDISLKTVEVHRYNILKKLQLKNTAALVNLINTSGL